MSLSSLYLDAFLAVARSKGFSAAANTLNITQSALSHRIRNLESDLGLTLFIRTPTGATLTEQGERLLRYCQTRTSMEDELIQDLNVRKSSEMAGTVRVAAYSSVLRSVVIPALKPLFHKHPGILCEFCCANIPDLPGLLQRAETDFIVTDQRIERAGIEAKVLGREKYVLIESRKESLRDDIFLDNDAGDRATELYFKAQGGKVPKFRRSYFDDCYGIIDGVALGLGRAVMPEHLVSENSQIKVLKGHKAFHVDVTLNYYHQPFYSKLHQSVVDHLCQNAGKFLKS